MIYTIGYQRLSHERLRAIMQALGIVKLVDVRSIPQSRRPGFGGRQLREAFPDQYLWKGDVLGGIKPGKPGTTHAGLRWAVEAGRSFHDHILLLCVCHAPGSCHRHVLVARQLLAMETDCRHIYEDEIVLASELERALNDDDYEYKSEPLDL